MAAALASCERPAGPLLQAVQGQIDLAIATRCALKLQMRMLADGHAVGHDRLQDGIAAGAFALACWRSGVRLVRDGWDGGDIITQGEVIPDTAARIAWRGTVTLLSGDNFGESIPLTGGAEDDWLCAQALPSESRTERAARLFIERHAGQRQILLRRRLDTVTPGRGRRAAAVDKVGNAAALILGGESLQAAALAVGFKDRGRSSATDAFLQAAKRLKLIAPGFTARLRGKSQAGLKQVVPELVRAFIPAAALPVGESVIHHQRGGAGAGAHCGARCLAAAAVRSVIVRGPSPARLAARAARGALRLELERGGWQFPLTA